MVVVVVVDAAPAVPCYDVVRRRRLPIRDAAAATCTVSLLRVIYVVGCGGRGVATAGGTGDASPVRPTMSPYIKMTTVCLRS